MFIWAKISLCLNLPISALVASIKPLKAPPALLITAAASNQGKSSVALALIAYWKNRGLRVGACKVGPDYIDGGLHHAMGADVCINLDLWAMNEESRRALWHRLQGMDRIVIEGVMGLFDRGAVNYSTADVASYLNVPVIMVVDGSHMAQSAAALLKGFANYRQDCSVAGVLFNRIKSQSHCRYLEEAAREAGVMPLGCLPPDDRIHIPSRPLGLHQGHELNASISSAMTGWLGDNVDMEALQSIAKSSPLAEESVGREDYSLRGVRHLAVARDEAFSFRYPWLEHRWQQAGSRISYFSPLASEMPDLSCDAVMLVGGYPEDYASSLGDNFFSSLRQLAERNIPIYGECGGFMVLGRSLMDRSGVRHKMAGLLPVDFSFENNRCSLGYRRGRLLCDSFFASMGSFVRGHEFHYGQITAQEGEGLFQMEKGDGDFYEEGCRKGSVMGSFFHLIDKENN